MDGIIIINKPYGISSHRAVQEVRRLFPGHRAGHSGTLDPLATGVLPVCTGKATRIVEYLVALPKVYRAAVTLGKSTDSGDAGGTVVAEKTVPGLKAEAVEAVIRQFEGRIEQQVPIYSAAKYRGKPFYHYARRGEKLPRRVRTAEIYGIEIISFQPRQEPHLVLEVKCSKGTYMRSLAVDIGNIIGCGAYLSALVRLAVGPYDLDQAVSPEEAANLAEKGRLRELIRPMDSALPGLPRVTLDRDQVRALKNGRAVSDVPHLTKKLDPGAPVSAYDQDGGFQAIVTLDRSGGSAVLKTVKFLGAFTE